MMNELLDIKRERILLQLDTESKREMDKSSGPYPIVRFPKLSSEFAILKRSFTSSG